VHSYYPAVPVSAVQCRADYIQVKDEVGDTEAPSPTKNYVEPSLDVPIRGPVDAGAAKEPQVGYEQHCRVTEVHRTRPRPRRLGYPGTAIDRRF